MAWSRLVVKEAIRKYSVLDIFQNRAGWISQCVECNTLEKWETMMTPFFVYQQREWCRRNRCFRKNRKMISD